MPNKPADSELRQVDDTNKEIAKWWRRVDLAQTERKDHEDEWDMLVDAYKPSVKERGQAEDVKTNIHFRNTEQKKAQLFFRSPEMKLQPRDLLRQPVQGPDGQAIDPSDAVAIHEAVLNYHMGPDVVNLSHLADRVLFDCLVPSGLMVTKIGYRPYITTVQQPQVQALPVPVPGPPDPMTGMPTMNEEMQEVPVLDELGEPVMEDVPVVVKEEYFWRRVSPKRVLIPEDFHDTDFELAPWLGVEFEMSFRDARRLYQLPKDFEPKKGEEASSERLLGENRKTRESKEDIVQGIEIFYKAHLFREDVVHPDVYYQLVLIKGHRENGQQVAAVHRMSPYQTLDPTTGKLTADSMLGNPIHVGTIRDLSDSAYVPSDVAMTHALVKEIDTYRQQTIKLRDAQLPRLAFDVEAFPPAAVQAFKQGDVGQFIPLEGGRLAQGANTIVAPLTTGSSMRIDQEGAFLLAQDAEKTLAISSNQQAGTTDGIRTATELSLIQSNANVRLEKEQTRVLEYFLAGIRKYDSLLQRFQDDAETVEIVGDDGVRRLQQWNKDVIAGRFAYDIHMDSQIRLDAATERNLWMQFYNLTAQDPFNDRRESLKKLQRLFGIDPAKAMVQPPEPGPPPPSVTTRFGGDDIAGPAAPIVLSILEQAGYQFSEEDKALAIALGAQAAAMERESQMAPEQAQPGVPGPAEKLPPISKKQGELTGSLPGPSDAEGF